MRLGTLAAAELLQAGSIWQLQAAVNGYSRPRGTALATQAWAGRQLQVLQQASLGSRLRARLLDDGYPCWLEPADLLGHAAAARRRPPLLLSASAISARLPAVLAFAKTARQQPNRYLWGGSLGPHYDCSGLVQRAFASAGIWIPRDAYLQERFCQPVAVRAGVVHALRPGDLIFFGPPQRCTHVGLHLGDGRYLHSSGPAHGRDGIGLDDLAPHNDDPVARHYRLQLRGAGRVIRCHDGTPLPA
jgi:cell wall-associated NlpC family hydrolase